MTNMQVTPQWYLSQSELQGLSENSFDFNVETWKSTICNQEIKKYNTLIGMVDLTNVIIQVWAVCFESKGELLS